MGTYDDPLGSILIGTWISSMLFMLIIRETITYYTSKSDALGVKIFVALAVLVDTVSLSGDFAEVYLYTISHWGDLKFLSNQTWPFTLYLATTGVTGLLVQSFLVNRYYALTKNWLICVFLTLCIIVSYGGSLATVIILTRFNAYDQRFMIKIPVIVWLTMTSVTGRRSHCRLFLIWQLYNMKTSFKTTEHLIQRLMLTVRLSEAFLMPPISLFVGLVGTALAFILGRVYILTLLYNLNIRKTSKKEGGTSTSDHDYRSHRGPAVAMEGIHVQRTAVVHMDTSGDDLALAPSSYKSQHDDKVPEMV
ncbi:hypothetical protein BDZ89DRAFT_1060592 [Hymenopellis radicata]|nr:hypothetical protein BDZ89DRAFT_1060592 [Hymenopellis radicata]